MTEHDKEESTLVSTDENSSTAQAAAEDSDANEVSATERSERATPPEASAKKRLISRLPLILLLLTLMIAGLLGGAGWWFWTAYQHDFIALQQQQQTLLEELQSSQRKIAGFEQLNDQTNAAWQAGVKSLESMVIESAQRMNRQANRTNDRWPLEEALTLTRLAQQRLQLDASAQVAIGLLKSADTIFSGMDQAAVLPLRRQLAQDILALQNTSAADINGHYFALDAVANQVRNLAWLPKPVTQSPIPDEADPLTGFWHGLKQIVVVSRLDLPMQPVPLQSDFERWRQHTLLLLEQAQLALLARNQPLYDAALEQSLEQLEFMQNQLKLAALITSVAELQGATLNPQWPDIGQSVDIIEQYLAEQQTQADAEGAQ